MKQVVFALTLLSFGTVFLHAQEAGGTSNSKSCLAKYEDRVGDMLPESRLREVVDPGDNELKSEVNPKGMLKSARWSWPSGRVMTKKIGAMNLELPVDNQVSISDIRVLDNAKHGPKDGKTYVEFNYRSISKEEMKKIQESMARGLQERVDKGEITAEQAKLAGGLGGGFMGEERIVETIEGIGDSCRWVEKDKTLAVGHGNVFFALLVDVSEDSAVNREKAIALAKLILAECD